jgi:NAD+ diphosphatase
MSAHERRSEFGGDVGVAAAPRSMTDHRALSARNFFSGLALDRAGARRTDAAWLAERAADPGTVIVPVSGQRNLFRSGQQVGVALLSPAELPVLPEQALCFLGERGGRAHFALAMAPGVAGGVDPDDVLCEGLEFGELRDLGGLLTPEEGALLAYARALVHWHDQHRYCGACGAPTRSIEGGHMRRCLDNACGRRHFPRTDPAVIVLVVSPTEASGPERCLLGRPAAWPPRLYSTVAGFVEPGETMEEAVVREVAEETGVRVGEVYYHSSQPWPFPSSLMLGFRAQAQTQAIDRADDELEDARWFSRDDIAEGVAAGTLRLPRRVSIAYRLVEDWFDAGTLGPLARHLTG